MRKARNTSINAIVTHIVIRASGAMDGGSMKLGVTPGGGGSGWNVPKQQVDICHLDHIVVLSCTYWESEL